MKLKRIKLFNIGPYVGENIISFNLANKEKNITLIGGKNGAGKTTLFTAIKACLYGYRAFGFEAIGYKYYDEILKIVNSSIKTQAEARASIEIELLVDDGKYNNTYILVREWMIQAKGISEASSVFKNGTEIQNDEKVSFLTYLDSLIPQDLFNFYFFDGEKIGDYFLSNNSDQNFKKAFLTLCGLDSISLMVTNFERIYKAKKKQSQSAFLYYECKEKLDMIEKILNAKQQEYQNLLKKFDAVNDDLSAHNLKYSQAGGLSIDEWKKINIQILEQESIRESLNKLLKETANNFLPFVIVRKQLVKLLEQMDLEQNYNRSFILSLALKNKKVFKYLQSVLKEDVNPNEIIGEIFKLIDKSNIDINNFNEKLCLSRDDESKLRAIISSKLQFDENEIKIYISRLKKSLSTSKKLRQQLNLNNVEKMEEFAAIRDDLVALSAETRMEIDSIYAEIVKLDEQRDGAVCTVEKVQKEFEIELKNNSISDIASRALFVYRNIEEKLIYKYAKLLQDKFIGNFNSIINKDKFIDGIDVDMKLNVRPYKNTSMKKSEFDARIATHGELYFMNDIGVRSKTDLENAKKSIDETVYLPVVIKTEFSQGEKQVYIMALYISLLQIANVNVPFIIDTPFARIDSEHREKIVENFFKKIQSQVIILSTDEEIVGKFKNQMQDKIGGELMLKSLSHGTSKIINGEYFEVNNGI